jgi:hypothetical protein
MPNPLDAKVPYVRPENNDAGLSLIVQPKYDYVNTFPPDAVADNDGNQPSGALFDNDFVKEANERRKMLGQVPLAPGGVSSFNEAKRYNDPNLGFVAGRDNEDLYAQNQGVMSSIGHGAGRLAGLTVTKLGTGLGYLAGLVGVGNDSEKYGDGFGAWIAGAGDNGVAKWFDNLENDKIKNDWLPIYKKASEKDHGFFRHMGDLDFWTDDATDGAAFMMSSFIPGMAASKLNLGAKAIRGIAALRGLQYADEASALAREGVSGTVESENLLKQGLGADVEQPAPPTLKQPDVYAAQEIPRAIKWIDNAKAARTIDVGSTSIINTTSQAMMSANEAKNSAFDALLAAKDDNGNNKYTADEAKSLSAKVAKDSYLMNLGALGVMNLWEANFLFKKAPLSNAMKGVEANGLLGDATLAERSFGKRAYDAIKEPGKGFLTGGVWLGNMQLAIDRLNQNPDNFDLDFGTKFKDLGKQYVKQLKDAFSGDDTDASKGLGIGGLMGAVVGKVMHGDENARRQGVLDKFNNQVSAFREMGNIYQTNEDGSTKLVNGSPVLDEEKMGSWVASMNKILNLNQLSNNFESKNVPELAKLYKDEVFARFAKAHFDAGLSDLLRTKMRDVQNLKPEDLALLGFDTYDRTTDTKVAAQSDYFKGKIGTLEDIYNNINQNYLPQGIDMNTKEGQAKHFDITDKMFYLTARSYSLAGMSEEANRKYEHIKANADAYNADFNATTDDVASQYNQHFEDLEAAKRRKAQEFDSQVSQEQDMFAQLNEPGTPEVRLPEGSRSQVLVIGDGAIDEKQKALDEYMRDNRETLEKLKKDSRGRYLYEIANKNFLPSAKDMENQQVLKAELGLANAATLNVLGRLADPRYGPRYFDEIYSDEMKKHAQENDLYSDVGDDLQPSNDGVDPNLPAPDRRHFKTDIKPEDITRALEEAKFAPPTAEGEELAEGDEDQYNKSKIGNKTELAEHLAEKTARGEDLTDEEQKLKDILSKEVADKLEERNSKADIDDIFGELSDLRRKKDALEGKDDRTLEEENQLNELNNKIDALEEQRDDAFDRESNQMKVNQSANIKPGDKEKVLGILQKISDLRKRVKKYDDYYEVDGKKYRKVTHLIGDSISDSQRSNPATQAAVNAGYTIDSIVKAYFSNDLSQDFKDSLGSNISHEAYGDVVKSLDKIKTDLMSKGIEIVGSNVLVTDDTAKVAGEIDLLGVDKEGNFKIYEIQARRPDVYRQYGKRGLGITIRDIDSKRLSTYRNMFANQYGATPDEIAVKFPFEVKYDKTNPSGYIDDTKLKAPIRFTPVKNVEIKMRVPEPIRVGSKFNAIDMTRIFLDTFLTDKGDKGKLSFLFRNIPFKQLANGVKLRVKPSEGAFAERYAKQSLALRGLETDYKINKFRDFRDRDELNEPREFKNLYSLVGNTEASLTYDGQPIGYLSPVETLAYKDTDGTFKILDENTDPQTYANVTGNDISTFGEFQRVSSAYKKLHTELTNMLQQSGGKEVTLGADMLKGIADLKMSYGEFDLVKGDKNRPDLKDLKFPGVKVGNKVIPTVVNVDENGGIKVLMDKGRNGKSVYNKYQQVDKWANANSEQILAAITDKGGSRATDNAAIIETPDGDFKIVSLRTKEGVDLSKEDNFVENLGSKVTAATSKDVFKNEGIMIVPKESDEKINVGLKEQKVISQIYPTEDINTLEKSPAVPPAEQLHVDNTAQIVDNFLNDARDDLKQDLEDMRLDSREAILNDFQNGEWSNIQDYLDDLSQCK